MRDTTLPCQENDPELWFSEHPESLSEARRLCGLCPAINQCLRLAIERPEPCGVWGGQLISNGRIVQPRKRRKFGQKSKADPEKTEEGEQAHTEPVQQVAEVAA